jgi:hypothetical protein
MFMHADKQANSATAVALRRQVFMVVPLEDRHHRGCHANRVRLNLKISQAAEARRDGRRDNFRPAAAVVR